MRSSHGPRSIHGCSSGAKCWSWGRASVISSRVWKLVLYSRCSRKVSFVWDSAASTLGVRDYVERGHCCSTFLASELRRFLSCFVADLRVSVLESIKKSLTINGLNA